MIDVIACPNCQRMLNLPPDCEGQEVQCPSCKTQFRAVAPAPPVTPFVPGPAVPAPPAITIHEEEIDPGSPPPPSRRTRPRPRPQNVARPSKSSGAKAVWMVPVGAVILMTCLCGLINSLDRRHHEMPPRPQVMLKQPNNGFGNKDGVPLVGVQPLP